MGRRNFLIASLLMTNLAWFSGSALAQNVHAPQTSPIKAGDKVPVIVVTLRPHGFEPEKLTLSQNTVIIHIVNRAGGVGDPNLKIKRQSDNAQVYADKASQNGNDTWRILVFEKGKFTMTLSNHSTAALAIEVTQ